MSAHDLPARALFSDRQLQLAAAVLFLQMVRADLEHRQDEHRALQGAVERVLGLDQDAAVAVIRLAEERVKTSAAFHEFVATRERCGEPADGIPYEKFAAKLKKNHEQLVQKYGCRTVRFQVHVKDGKAALKATPIKD